MNGLVRTAGRLGIVILLTGSCNHGDSPADTARAHRAQWEASGISDYTWRVYVGCFCDAGISIVKVVDGKPVDLLVHGEPASIKLDQEQGYIPLTMEDLFDVLDEAYAEHAQTVKVTYDENLGYPTDISIDPNYGCQTQADGCVVYDDETQYTVKSFEKN